MTALAPWIRWHRQRLGDAGSVSIFAVILTLVVVVFFGAVVDFEQKLEARQDANTVAQEAARAGAGRVDLNRAYSDGEFTVDRHAAIAAARDHLRASGYTGTVTASGARAIRVHVTITRPALFLPVIGISHLRADGTATANLTTGVRGPTQP
ncbi:pilus assembly protein TadG-related protein [Actinomadura bangladeshensis]|uniref:pilus assembly protein TadG-related protein n=1 Tax=Actinomadura bangladeshensis TaxID=453573 RepID=UPI0031E1B52A